MPKRKYPIVEVFWWDAGSGATIEEAKGHHRTSVGYLIENDDDGVVISMEPDMLSGVDFITRPMLTDIKVIKQ